MTTRRRLGIALLAALAIVIQCGEPTQAERRHRRIHPVPVGPVFDRRPILSQATVGALSLDILTAGAAEALAVEDELYGWPRYGYPLPPLDYGAP